jgi:2-oxoglutarate ferredoxin oxidoreductase subunit gamma
VRKEIRIAGFGGQGVALAGLILGKALALYENVEAVMTQSYGPEARGGASSANIVLSDQPIAYPFVQHADILVALSQEGYTRFRPETGEDAIIIIDEELVTPSQGDRVYGIPATRLAEEMGRRMVMNTIALGFLIAVTGIASRESLEKSIQASVKAKMAPLNLQALARGYEYSLVSRAVPSGQAEPGRQG